MPSHTANPLLLIDAGNTRIKCSVCARPESRANGLPAVITLTAVPRGDKLPWNELLKREPGIGHFTSAIAGSNPIEVARIVGEWPADWTTPLVVNDRRTFPITIDVDFPEKVGIDRLLTAIAGNVLRPAGHPAVIIDSGTATTVNYVDEQGRFCGGAILPGFELCAKALHDYTALLPLIEMHEVLHDDGAPAELGRNTQAAITSGLYWGHVGAVKELLQRVTQDVRTEPLVLLTGGAAPLLNPHLPGSVRFEPHLALQGLAIVVAGLMSAGGSTEDHTGREGQQSR